MELYWSNCRYIRRKNEKDYLEIENVELNKNEEDIIKKLKENNFIFPLIENIKAAEKTKEKENSNLVDITAYKLGVEIDNTAPKDQKLHGNIMFIIIKKYSKIPSSSEKKFNIK